MPQTDDTSLNQIAYKKYCEEHSQLSLFRSTKFLAHRDLPKILSQHLLEPNKKKKYKILDYGCGAGEPLGFVAAIFNSFGCEVELHGVDISQDNLEVAQKNNPNAQFHLIEKSSFPENLNDFDLVICNFVLLENTMTDMNNILKNINQALNAEGIAIITHNRAKVYDSDNKWFSFNTDFDQNKRDYFDAHKNKYTRADGKSVKKEVYGASRNFNFYDFFYRRNTYKNAFTQANLELLTSYKPLGEAEDKIEWKSESNIAPYRIDILRKNMDRTLTLSTAFQL